MGSAAKELVARLTTTLEVYRLTLAPGAYCFGAKLLDGKPTGGIVMEMVPLTGRQRLFGAVFGFWPEGFAAQRSSGQTLDDVLRAPPPLEEVSQLHRAPERFLEQLMAFVSEKVVLETKKFELNQAKRRPVDPSSPPPDSQRLLAEATCALEVYRRMLPPGHYRFYAEMADAEPAGIIEEKKKIVFPGPAPEAKMPVLFGFWPYGRAEEQFAAHPALKQVCDFPQVVEISRLSRAPDRFLELLTRHVNQKTGLAR